MCVYPSPRLAALVQPTRPWFFNYSATSEAVLAQKDLLFGPSLALRGGGSQFGGEIVDYEHGGVVKAAVLAAPQLATRGW